MLIGFGKATELVLLDPVLSAQQAQEWGLVNRVVDDADLWKEANEIINKLAAGPTGPSPSRRKTSQCHARLLYRQLELERSGMIRAAQSDDYREASRRSSKKRTAAF